jgi:hypothetical protein
MPETYSVEAILTARDAGFEAGMKAAQKSTQSLGAVLKKRNRLRGNDGDWK